MTRRRPIPFFFGAIALAVILLGVLPSQSFSQDDTGEHDFRLYCSNCHGEGGQGDGPKTFGLSGPAPDLTGLSERNGGVFPGRDCRRSLTGARF